ncbi:MAG: ribosome maturation factor RimM [Chloroflexota bacterium]
MGQVMGAFGPLGDLRVQAFSDRPGRFKAVQRIFVGQALTPARILRRGVHGIGLTLRLDTVTTRERARALFGEYLYLPDAESIKLQPGEYFIHQLIGLTVADEAGTEIGRLTEVIQTGSNDVYVVNGPKGEILLPVIPDVIKNVDLDGRSMTVHLLPGLIDD